MDLADNGTAGRFACPSSLARAVCLHGLISSRINYRATYFMFPPSRDLRSLQAWLQEAITAADERPVEDLEQVILPGARQTSTERLQVYAEAYSARLLECLQHTFPVLWETIGHEAFAAFGFAYLQRHPPQSYTLDRLGDRLPEFLDATRAQLSVVDESGSGEEPGENAFAQLLIDLARLELAIDQVFDGPGSEGDPPLDVVVLENLTPEAFAAARLRLCPSVKLLEFRTPVSGHFTAVRRGEPWPEPERRVTFLALSRRNYVVQRHELSRPQFVLLSILACGETIGQAITAAAESCQDADPLGEELRSWFDEWSAAGLFAELEPSQGR